MSARVVELELTQLAELTPVAPHVEAVVVLRVHGHPVGTVRIDCPDGGLRRHAVESAVRADPVIARRIAERVSLHLVLPVDSEPIEESPPTWTVVVCTRDRPRLLHRCLKAIGDLEVSSPQVVVVDNAPSTPEARAVCADFTVDYHLEPRPGLNRARRRAAAAARGEVVLFTDDDVVVDVGWATALLAPFATSRVGCVTGLTMPVELETDAQELFERRGGLGRGFDRRVVDFSSSPAARAGGLGAGANMAFRRELIDQLGLFDADIDCGTEARTGGDVYAFYRLLEAGYRLVYTPDALAWHQHRSDFAALRDTLQGYSTGGYTWLLRALLHHRDPEAARAALGWLRRHHVPRLLGSLLRRPGAAPLDVSVAEWKGILAVPRAYRRTAWDRAE